MRIELKQAIIKWIFEHLKEFQILNACKDAFHEYIYDSKGKYLIGGAKVSGFIDDAVRFIKREM